MVRGMNRKTPKWKQVDQQVTAVGLVREGDS